jgi:peptidylprolyl isomerase
MTGNKKSENTKSTLNNKDEVKVKEKVNTKNRTAKDGDIATVHYTGSLESGEVFDSSKDRAPLEFEVGSGQLIKGFDTAVVGMKVGDKKTVLLSPADAYGDRDERRIQKLPRSSLPKEPEPKPGMMLTISTPDGKRFPAKIDKVEKDVVMIDMNHPLAGKKLKFDIELVGVKDNIKDKKDCSHDKCGCCGCD